MELKDLSSSMLPGDRMGLGGLMSPADVDLNKKLDVG